MDDTTCILITGANAGLGFDTCRRIIDEFLTSRPQSQSLHLIITTRSAQKASATTSRLRKHVQKTHPKRLSADRLTISPVELDLTSLVTVIDASKKIASLVPRLDVLICNAGIAGWTGINWPRAIWESMYMPLRALTWPSFLLSSRGWTTPKQLPKQFEEPPLGEVFCANVFGHYLLAHHLSPLLSHNPIPGRLIWISTIDAVAHDFSLQDLQCLDTSQPYNSSKRLSDILGLTALLPAASASVSSFLPGYPRPKIYVAHPGVASSEIMPLHPLVLQVKIFTFYIARFLGSPWHSITTYKGAVAPTWLALSPQSTLDAIEERDGIGKWGSATDWKGGERVMRTEVEGWGWGGKVGERADRRGRHWLAKDLTAEARDEFEELGAKTWRAMEKLRMEWEARFKEAGAL